MYGYRYDHVRNRYYKNETTNKSKPTCDILPSTKTNNYASIYQITRMLELTNQSTNRHYASYKQILNRINKNEDVSVLFDITYQSLLLNIYHSSESIIVAFLKEDPTTTTSLTLSIKEFDSKKNCECLLECSDFKRSEYITAAKRHSDGYKMLFVDKHNQDNKLRATELNISSKKELSMKTFVFNLAGKNLFATDFSLNEYRFATDKTIYTINADRPDRLSTIKSSDNSDILALTNIPNSTNLFVASTRKGLWMLCDQRSSKSISLAKANEIAGTVSLAATSDHIYGGNVFGKTFGLDMRTNQPILIDGLSLIDEESNCCVKISECNHFVYSSFKKDCVLVYNRSSGDNWKINLPNCDNHTPLMCLNKANYNGIVYYNKYSQIILK